MNRAAVPIEFTCVYVISMNLESFVGVSKLIYKFLIYSLTLNTCSCSFPFPGKGRIDFGKSTAQSGSCNAEVKNVYMCLLQLLKTAYSVYNILKQM